VHDEPAAAGAVRAVFFDVDFTLIHPGPTFQGEGYRRFCAGHGVQVDPARFERAVEAASFLLDEAQEQIYDPQLFIGYTRRIIEGMGGTGEGVEASAREIYEEWAACQHFSLYEDVGPALREIRAAGYRIGLISNTQRCLASFQSHFELEGLITGAVSSSQHGYMKPHPSIFRAAMELLGVTPGQSVMVGDHTGHDIEGAIRAGMRAVLVRRSAGEPFSPFTDSPNGPVPVIASLAELRGVLERLGRRGSRNDQPPWAPAAP
jgi:putative hydrolase of the HAD superfamily